MDGFDTAVMVALLPTTRDWSRLQFPHLTLVFAGEISDLAASAYSEMLKVAVTIGRDFGPQVVPVKGVDKFGSDESVDVLVTQKTPELISMRAMLEEFNASEHPFTPHATIGPEGAIVGLRVPLEIKFDRITVGYGDQYQTYSLWDNKIQFQRPGVIG